jgi:hypothetical protein
MSAGLKQAWSESNARPLSSDSIRSENKALLKLQNTRTQIIKNQSTWPILHNHFQSSMFIGTLPPRNKMKQMHTVTSLAIFFARVTCKLYLHNVEHWNASLLVFETNKPS